MRAAIMTIVVYATRWLILALVLASVRCAPVCRKERRGSGDEPRMFHSMPHFAEIPPLGAPILLEGQYRGFFQR